MAAKDIINEKLARLGWLWQRHLMRMFLSETRRHHYCAKCGGIMHYGVRPYPTYDCMTGQPYGMEFILRCENHTEAHSNHDSFEKFMFDSPFIINYLQGNMYILGARTVLDVFEEAY